MNLIIDIGNTRIKLAVFEDNTLDEVFYVNQEIFFKTLISLSDKPIKNAIISSVVNVPKEIIDYLETHYLVIYLNQQTKVPFKNRYATPETLGVDRIALVAAASTQFPLQNVLVIDAGSCITYDLITKNKEYLGGAITPGLEMRLKAMHHFTDKLPLLTLIDEDFSIGNSTNNSLYFGVTYGTIAEIEGFISHFKSKNKKLTVVLTGGDTIFLAKRLKNKIFANSNFLLEGLNSILEFNLKTKNE